MTDALKHYETQWQREHDKCKELEQEAAILADKLRSAENQLREQRRAQETLQQSLDEARQALNVTHAEIAKPEKLNELKKLLLTPQEWTNEFIVPFVDELNAFDLLSEFQNSGHPTMPLEWCQQLEKHVESLAEIYDGGEVLRTKKTLIALWVYVQWLELTHGSTL